MHLGQSWNQQFHVSSFSPPNEIVWFYRCGLGINNVGLAKHGVACGLRDALCIFFVDMGKKQISLS